MAGKLADAVVVLTAQVEQLQAGLNKAQTETAAATGSMEKSTTGMGSVMQGVFQGVGQGLLGLAADALRGTVGYLKDALGAASDMGETTSKIGVLFGDSSDELQAWAETAAVALGQSKQQALDAAANFGIFGKAAGLSGGDLNKFSTDFVGLASDLASFNNTTPEQAIEAIGAALRGEAEPLRTYGVLLDDASMRQKALELGIIDNVKNALTPQQKILAAQALIYEQTSAAQGDFERTSAGAANQQRILDAQLTNLKTTIGGVLLPVWGTLISTLNDVVQNVLPPVSAFVTEQIVPAMQEFADIVGTAIQAVIDWFASLGTAVDEDGVGAFAYFQEWIDENLPRIQEIIENVLTAIQEFWAAHGEAIMTTVSGTMGLVMTLIDGVMVTILDLITLILQLLNGEWTAAGATLREIVVRIWNGIKWLFSAALDGLLALVGLSMGTLSSTWSAAWAAVYLAYQKVEGYLVAGWETIRRWATETIPNAFGSLRDAAVAKWQEIQDAVTSKITPITDKLGSLKTWLTTTIQDAFGSLKTFVSGLSFPNPFSGLTGWIGELIDDIRWVIDNLPLIGGGSSRGKVRGNSQSNVNQNQRLAATVGGLTLGAAPVFSFAPAGSGASGGAVSITVNVAASVTGELDEYRLAHKVADVVRRSMR